MECYGGDGDNEEQAQGDEGDVEGAVVGGGGEPVVGDACCGKGCDVGADGGGKKGVEITRVFFTFRHPRFVPCVGHVNDDEHLDAEEEGGGDASEPGCFFEGKKERKN